MIDFHCIEYRLPILVEQMTSSFTTFSNKNLTSLISYSLIKTLLHFYTIVLGQKESSLFPPLILYIYIILYNIINIIRKMASPHFIVFNKNLTTFVIVLVQIASPYFFL